MGKRTGFKEWESVCEAMGLGLQSLILRKGGIHEGAGGFQFQHRKFFLFPTAFHAQWDQLKPEIIDALGHDGSDLDAGGEPDRTEEEENRVVSIRFYAEVDRVFLIKQWDAAAALDAFHAWSEAVVQERFAYTGERCLHAALVRVYRLAQPWSFPYEKRFGGCRSWLELPEPTENGSSSDTDLTSVPVLDDAGFAEVKTAVEETLEDASVANDE